MTHARRPALSPALVAAALCLMALGVATLKPPAAAGQKAEAQRAQTSVTVRWPGRPGVGRYRLQVATDEKFEDIVFDGAVEGRQHTLTELAPGSYFWRVASAAAETSSFSKPERMTVAPNTSANAGSGPVTPAGLLTPEESSGWRTATGEVARLAAGARLRPGAVVDFVGVTADGKVFAVDGANGLSLWNARAEGAASSGFAPLVVETKGGAAVLAAAEGGVRLLRGDTGRELWRAKLEGAAAAAAAADLDGDGAQELIVAAANPPAIYSLAADTGRVLASAKLDAEVIGAPVPYAAGEARGVLLALGSDTVQARGAGLAAAGSLKLDARVTTAPLLISRGEARVLVVGSERGLVAMQFPELKVLGQIVSENDPVRGALATADVDGDGSAEIVLVTKSGRVALVGTNDGNVRWYAEGAGGAESATLTELDGDGVLDVVVPGGSAFALGFSGRDGSLMLRAEESGAKPAATRGEAATRTIAVAPSLGGGLLLVGADGAGTGLRALEVPKGGGAKAGAVRRD